MNATESVHRISLGEYVPRPSARTIDSPSYQELAGPLRLAILQARRRLADQQGRDGSWLGRRIGDASFAGQLVLLLVCLGRKSSELVQHAAASIVDQQLANGGWSRHPGGPADVNISVQAYLALRIAGHNPADHVLAQARAAIRALGGADAADTVTHLFLALFGLIRFDNCRRELPEWLPGRQSRLGLLDQRNLRAAWAVVWTKRPKFDAGLSGGIRELFIDHPAKWSQGAGRSRGHRIAARFVRSCEALISMVTIPLRRRALNWNKAELLRHVDASRIEALDFAELAWHTIALLACGHAVDDPAIAACESRLKELVWVDEYTECAWPQARLSPLADTVLCLRALRASGAPYDEVNALSACRWLAEYTREKDSAPRPADVAGIVQLLQSGADQNAPSPDALPPGIRVRELRSRRRDGLAKRAAKQIERTRPVAKPLVRALIAARMVDGGWSGRTNSACASTPGVTGELLTAIAPYAGNDVCYRVDCAVAYLREMQRADGGWASDGESTVRDTSQAVSGLLAAGVPRDDKAVVAAIHWLLVYQQQDGGWGADGASREVMRESCSDDSAAQTAWGVIALVAAGRANDAATRRAVQFLLDTQQPDGDWEEGYSTRTFPTKDGIRPNNIEATAWPLIALSQWAVAAAALQDFPAGPPALRLVAAAAED